MSMVQIFSLLLLSIIRIFQFILISVTFQYKEINGVVVKVKKAVDYEFQCFDNELTTLFLKRLH